MDSHVLRFLWVNRHVDSSVFPHPHSSFAEISSCDCPNHSWTYADYMFSFLSRGRTRANGGHPSQEQVLSRSPSFSKAAQRTRASWRSCSPAGLRQDIFRWPMEQGVPWRKAALTP